MYHVFIAWLIRGYHKEPNNMIPRTGPLTTILTIRKPAENHLNNNILTEIINQLVFQSPIMHWKKPTVTACFIHYRRIQIPPAAVCPLPQFSAGVHNPCYFPIVNRDLEMMLCYNPYITGQFSLLRMICYALLKMLGQQKQHISPNW